MKNVLELLEIDELQYSNKKALIDENTTLTYGTLAAAARRVGSGILKTQVYGRTAAIYMDKCVDVIVSMMGIVYSGNVYSVIDSEMPVERIKKIFSTLDPELIITDKNHKESAAELCDKVYLIDNLKMADADSYALRHIRDMQIDTDPLYILYTSGSTGVPKGTVITHRNVLSYSKWAADTFCFDENTIAGNQTPFCFSMSVTDIYATIRGAGTLVIIPPVCFTFPVKLIEFMNSYKINTIYWVPSAYGIAANFKLFEYEKPKYLKKALFAGEVMPAGYLRYWIRHLGVTVLFANLYGPTETTDICTYYIVHDEIRDNESLPIGRHCDNCNTIIINSEGKAAAKGEEGELYVRGSFVSPGYYKNPEKTAEAFVQNPLNDSYPEICYRTGDLVKVGDNGDILYLGRRDFQIKRMGYRIELGEIESAAACIDGIRESACVFDRDKGKIIMLYSADKDSGTSIKTLLAGKINKYMLPDEYVQLQTMPRNQNGKIDRRKLEDMVNDGHYN